MHAAVLARSKRLQRVLGLLSDGRWHSTRDIVDRAHVCAVSSCIAELRWNGALIETRRRPALAGDSPSVWEYRLVAAPRDG